MPNPVVCQECNGELVRAMMDECTPERIAHLYVHELSRADKARAALKSVRTDAALALVALAGSQPTRLTADGYLRRILAESRQGDWWRAMTDQQQPADPTAAAMSAASPFTVSQEIPAQRVADLICGAFEGGSNYWAAAVSISDDGRPWSDVGAYASDVPALGGSVEVVEHEAHDDSGRMVWVLDRLACERGLRVMAADYPNAWAAFLSDNDDATTADVFLQCALFGEVIYG